MLFVVHMTEPLFFFCVLVCRWIVEEELMDVCIQVRNADTCGQQPSPMPDVCGVWRVANHLANHPLTSPFARCHATWQDTTQPKIDLTAPWSESLRPASTCLTARRRIWRNSEPKAVRLMSGSMEREREAGFGWLWGVVHAMGDGARGSSIRRIDSSM